MTPDEILRLFQNVPERCDFAPYEIALLAATVHRDALTPELIAAIDRVSANPSPWLKRGNNDYLHCFAIYLLAQFRERRALDAFLRLFSLPGEQALDLTGDMVTENGAAVIASVCGGDPAPLLRLANDESVNIFVRDQAIDALIVQHAWGERPRDAVIADLRGLFVTLQKPGDPYIWAGLVGAIRDFSALELLPEVRQAYTDGLVDDSIIGLEDIDPDLPQKRRGYPVPTPEQNYQWFCERNAPIDAVEEISGWLCFRDAEQGSESWDDDEIGLDDDEPLDFPKPEPYIAPPKIGRNDPCPCGSGKKYKKCCGK